MNESTQILLSEHKTGYKMGTRVCDADNATLNIDIENDDQRMLYKFCKSCEQFDLIYLH